MNLTTLFRGVDRMEGLEKSVLAKLIFSEQTTAKEYAEHLLSAHETLAELSPDNAKEFAAVIHCLRAELGAS